MLHRHFRQQCTHYFHDWLDEFVIVYLDDILVYSPTQEEHTRQVLRVLQRLNDNQWYCKLKKCEFAQTSIEYLGHIYPKEQLQ